MLLIYEVYTMYILSKTNQTAFQNVCLFLSSLSLALYFINDNIFFLIIVVRHSNCISIQFCLILFNPT